MMWVTESGKERHVNTHITVETRREKVTVTLRPERVAYADLKARERGVSRSEVIDSILAEAESREIDALMVAGYQAMAHESLELAEEGMESFWDIIKGDSDWPGTPERPLAER